MIRVSDELEPDYSYTKNGRGFYVCPATTCISKLKTGKTSMRRSLRETNIDNEKLTQLCNKLAMVALKESTHPVKVMNVQDKN